MNKELEFLEEKYGHNNWKHYPPSKNQVAQWLQEYTEKQLRLNGVSRSLPTNREQLSELVDKVYYKQIDEIEFDTVEDSFRLGIEFGIEELMPSENG